MELVNATEFSAGFVNTVISEDDLMAAVVCKPAFRIEGESLVPDLSDPWPIGPKPVATDFGEIDGELPFIKGGVDFLYLGSVHAPDGRAIDPLDVMFQVGTGFRRWIRVFGDRSWQRVNGSLVPTDPLPFTSMPLRYERAFGGECEVEAGIMPWPTNPVGTGFYMLEWQAEGNPLPNIEDPDQGIRSWEDRPDPIGSGPYPLKWGLRQVNGVEIDDSDPEHPRISRILPTYFNNAHPSFIVPDPVEPGATVTISHARMEGPLSFKLPELELHAHVQLEHRHWLFPMHLDQIVVMGDEARVLLSYRVCFTYKIVPLERRAVTIHEGARPGELPRGYPINFNVTAPWA